MLPQINCGAGASNPLTCFPVALPNDGARLGLLDTHARSDTVRRDINRLDAPHWSRPFWFLIPELAVEATAGTAETETRSIHLQFPGRRRVEVLLVAIGDIKGVAAVKMSPTQDGKE